MPSRFSATAWAVVALVAATAMAEAQTCDASAGGENCLDAIMSQAANGNKVKSVEKWMHENVLRPFNGMLLATFVWVRGQMGTTQALSLYLCS